MSDPIRSVGEIFEQEFGRDRRAWDPSLHRVKKAITALIGQTAGDYQRWGESKAKAEIQKILKRIEE